MCVHIYIYIYVYVYMIICNLRKGPKVGPRPQERGDVPVPFRSVSVLIWFRFGSLWLHVASVLVTFRSCSGSISVGFGSVLVSFRFVWVVVVVMVEVVVVVVEVVVVVL